MFPENAGLHVIVKKNFAFSVTVNIFFLFARHCETLMMSMKEIVS